MKILTIVLSVIALALAVFNAIKIDLKAPFTGDSALAFATMLAALCALLLLQILRISKRIEEQTKRKN